MTEMGPPDEPNWPAAPKAIRPHEGASWVLFAGIMIFLVGVINIIWGIAAVGNSRFFIDDATYVLAGLNTWGWIILVLGVAQLFAAYAIWRGAEWGRWFGIAVAGLNAIGALMSISAYPFWGLAVFIVDVLVIYGLANYGGDPRVLE
jgi:hypothetical protein